MPIFWGIFLFCLGIIGGFGAKLGLDQYHQFRQNEERRAKELDDMLVKVKAMELNKNL